MRKEGLEEKVSSYLFSHKRDEEMINKLSKRMSSHGYSKGEIIEITYDNGNHKKLSSVESILIAKYLTDDGFTKGELNPTEYYTDQEINVALQHFEDKETKMKLPLALENVLQVGYGEYVTTIHIRTLYKMYESGLIVYNFDTQRDAKLKKMNNGSIVRVANVNKKSVEEITNLLIKGTYIPDTLTLNLLVGTGKDGEELTYNTKKNELIVHEGVSIDILDGFHRLNAIREAYKLNPDLDIVFPLQVKNYDARKARQFVGQTNTVNVMPKQYVQQLKMDTHEDFVVTELMARSELKDRVSQRGSMSIKTGRQVTSIKKLTDAIAKVFNIQSKREAMRLISKLTVYFDELVGLYIESDIPYENSIFSIENAMLEIMKHAKEFVDSDEETIQLDIKNILLDPEEERTLGTIERKLRS
ncbi:DNA sulfur modification protein DndB [Exiguobacterium sp. s133]|uniref:DNA sulfur modification protein DndB n=1 Tax=Exiguobacterium sp. s133 TaxID=2751213 RepID=UPI001BE7AA33|nr:DNA sulfur modification protein DndB [Exiguobacterium sp. s133]